jgi:predicted ATP-dependent endonuclease of OLD family
MVETIGFSNGFLMSLKNLFFARGVMIVEGDAENILIPTLANIIGKDFHYGVSIVNVGGVGLSRYARIFLRQHTAPGSDSITIGYFGLGTGMRPMALSPMLPK